MAKDFMSTQTGGYGETIQSEQDNPVNPGEFDVNLNIPQEAPQPAPMEQPIAQSTEQPTEQVIEQPVAQENPVYQNLGLSNLDIDVSNDENFNDVLSTPEPTVLETPIDVSPLTQEFEEPDTTPDGFPIYKIQPKAEEPDDDGELEYEMEQPSMTPDGFPIFKDVAVDENPVDKEIIEVNKKYSSTPISVNNKGKVVITPKGEDPKSKKKAPLPDGRYVYSDRPDATYKKENKKWFIYDNGKNKFVPLSSGDVAKRTAVLEANAKPIKANSNRTMMETEKNLSTSFGNLGRFNLESQVTSGGDIAKANGATVGLLTRDNIGGNTERYNQDGTINFNYNPVVASVPKEARVLVDKKATKEEFVARDYGKKDGYYRFAGRPNAIYRKDNAKWYIDNTGTGKNFEELTENVDARTDALEAKAIPTVDDALNLIMAQSQPFMDAKKLTNLVLNVSQSSKLEKVNNEELKINFNDAQNFISKDVSIVMGDMLTEEQKVDLRALQSEASKIVGDGEYSFIKAKNLVTVLKDTEDFINDAREINANINEAKQKNISLDRLLYERKKESYTENLDLKDNSNFQDVARDMFENNSEMADFILSNVDSGNLKIDPKTGEYSFTGGATIKEQNYINSKMKTYLGEYNKNQDEHYHNVSEKIREQNVNLTLVKGNINRLEKEIDGFNSSSDPEYVKQAKLALTSEKRKLEVINKTINEFQNTKRGVLLTEPKQFAKDASNNMSQSAKNIISALPENLTPKQKFDLFYERLSAKTEKIATDNGISNDYWSKVNARGKDLLDWNIYGLDKNEQEYLKNKGTLAKLASLYYNNDNGFTADSAGFFESFMNGFAKILTPKTAASEGYFNETEVAQQYQATLQEQGLGKDDLITPKVMDDINKRTEVGFFTGEGLGEAVGTSAGIIVPIVLTSPIPGAAAKLAINIQKFMVGADAAKLGIYLARANKAYTSALESTKFGKYILKSSLETAAKLEIAGDVFTTQEGELNWISGLAGGVASEIFSVGLSKLGSEKALNFVKSIFGEKTDVAIKAFEKSGKLIAKGSGEVIEETAQEMSNVYQSTDSFQGMLKEVENRFGTLDQVEKFVLSSFVLGTAFALVTPVSAKDAYKNLPEEGKARINQILSAVQSDMDFAENKSSEYIADEKANVDAEKAIDQETPVTGEAKPTEEVKAESKTDEELADIEARKKSSLESIKPGGFVGPTPTSYETYYTNTDGTQDKITGKTEADVKQQIEDKYAQENKQGIPGEKQGGQEPIQTEPQQGSGNQEATTGGVVQEAQGEKVTTPSEATAQPTTQQEPTNAKELFNEVVEITKIRNATERNKAIASFDERNNGKFKKMSKIHTNFGSIIKGLEKNNLIKKDC